MRGKPVSRAVRKELDLVIVAARYASENRRLSLAQGYQRRGPVWGDVQLFDRSSLMEMIMKGTRVVAGRPGEIEGDIKAIAPIRLENSDGAQILIAGVGDASTDNLGVPLF